MGAGSESFASGAFRAAGWFGFPGLALQFVTTNVGAAGTYEPDISKGSLHIVRATGTPITIANPINVPTIPGFAPILILHIKNVSGGVLAAVTFGSQYSFSSGTPNGPSVGSTGNGNGSVTLFHFESGKWYETGKPTTLVPN